MSRNYLVRLKDCSSWHFQRAVPRDVQSAIGRKLWRVKAGRTLQEARRAVPALLEETDRLIREARGYRHLETHQEALLRLRGLSPSDLQPHDFHYLPQDPEEIDKVLSLPKVQLHTAEQLLSLAKTLKDPAAQTYLNWEKHLTSFLTFSNETYPACCSKEQAQAYRDTLLRTLQPSTIKTRFAYLAGLWSLMKEEGWCEENIFQGVLKRMKIPVKDKKTIDIQEIDTNATRLSDDSYLLYQLLRWSGMRLAEAAGLRYEDIRDGVIHLVPHDTRPLKTQYSQRQIPLHRNLLSLDLQGTASQRADSGLIFPDLYNPKTHRWGGGIVWSQQIGANPHSLRHNVTTQLRDAGINERVIGAVLGHSPTNITGSYGSVSLQARREAIELLH